MLWSWYVTLTSIQWKDVRHVVKLIRYFDQHSMKGCATCCEVDTLLWPAFKVTLCDMLWSWYVTLTSIQWKAVRHVVKLIRYFDQHSMKGCATCCEVDTLLWPAFNERLCDMLWSWYVTLTSIQWKAVRHVVKLIRYFDQHSMKGCATCCEVDTLLWPAFNERMCDMLWSWYVTLTSIQRKDVRHVVKLIRYFDQHSKKGCATCCEVDTLLWPAFKERMCDMLWSWYVTLTSIQWKAVRHVVKLIRYFDQHSMKGCATCCEVDTLLWPAFNERLCDMLWSWYVTLTSIQWKAVRHVVKLIRYFDQHSMKGCATCCEVDTLLWPAFKERMCDMLWSWYVTLTSIQWKDVRHVVKLIRYFDQHSMKGCATCCEVDTLLWPAFNERMCDMLWSWYVTLTNIQWKDVRHVVKLIRYFNERCVTCCEVDTLLWPAFNCDMLCWYVTLTSMHSKKGCVTCCEVDTLLWPAFNERMCDMLWSWYVTLTSIQWKGVWHVVKLIRYFDQHSKKGCVTCCEVDTLLWPAFNERVCDMLWSWYVTLTSIQWKDVWHVVKLIRYFDQHSMKGCATCCEVDTLLWPAFNERVCDMLWSWYVTLTSIQWKDVRHVVKLIRYFDQHSMKGCVTCCEVDTLLWPAFMCDMLWSWYVTLTSIERMCDMLWSWYVTLTSIHVDMLWSWYVNQERCVTCCEVDTLLWPAFNERVCDMLWSWYVTLTSIQRTKKGCATCCEVDTLLWPAFKETVCDMLWSWYVTLTNIQWKDVRHVVKLIRYFDQHSMKGCATCCEVDTLLWPAFKERMCNMLWSWYVTLTSIQRKDVRHVVKLIRYFDQHSMKGCATCCEVDTLLWPAFNERLCDMLWSWYVTLTSIQWKAVRHVVKLIRYFDQHSMKGCATCCEVDTLLWPAFNERMCDMLWSWYVTLTSIQWKDVRHVVKLIRYFDQHSKKGCATCCEVDTLLWPAFNERMCDMLWSWYVTLTSIQWKDVRHVVKLIRYFDQHSMKGCATCCEVDTLLWPAFNERVCDMLWSWYVTLTSIQWKDVRHVVKLIRYFDQHSMKGCATCCEVDTLLWPAFNERLCDMLWSWYVTLTSIQWKAVRHVVKLIRYFDQHSKKGCATCCEVDTLLWPAFKERMCDMLWSWYVTLTSIQWKAVRHVVKLIRYFDQHSMKGCATCCEVDTLLWPAFNERLCDMLWSWYVTLTSIQWKGVWHVVKLIRYFDQHSMKGCATCCEVDTLLWPAFNERMCDMLWSWYVTLTSIQRNGCVTCCEVDTLLWPAFNERHVVKDVHSTCCEVDTLLWPAFMLWSW